MRSLSALALLAIVTALCGPPARAQPDHDPAAALAAQRQAMAALSFLDGQWRGSAWTLRRNGERHALVQTERVGTMLDGSIRLIEGRGHEADGALGFNALGIVSYDPREQRYRMQSYAQGRTASFELTVRPDGFAWSMPAGPGTVRYSAVVHAGRWTEVGELQMPDRPAVKVFEMTLERIGPTDWPAAGAPAPR